jgi:hypothetical protein
MCVTVTPHCTQWVQVCPSAFALPAAQRRRRAGRVGHPYRLSALDVDMAWDSRRQHAGMTADTLRHRLKS